ncbi:MAG: hypothetical protein Q8K82_13750 [Gemmatimonadaceae bacterium]|nr:hypothetical protein [Gemmatimonadaceae bacterium]
MSREFLAIAPDAIADALKHTRLSRTKLSGLSRNARAVLANLE